MTETTYAARTSHAFVLTETVKVAELIYQGATQEDIRQRVLVEDLFQLRSQVSRERALQIVLKRLRQVPTYIQLIATGNPDTRQLTILFLILREHRLLRELIAEVLLDKIQGFDYVVTSADLRTFFEGKRDENSTVAAWSESTYKKVASNTVLVLVNAGLLRKTPIAGSPRGRGFSKTQPTSSKGNYQIRIECCWGDTPPSKLSAVPVPSALRQQLLADGLGHYLTLMLDVQSTAIALNTASTGSA